MELKILHFSDLHLGMQFSSYGEAAEALKEARYETLDRLIKIPNDRNCNLVVIAGDLFDRVSIKKMM